MVDKHSETGHESKPAAEVTHPPAQQPAPTPAAPALGASNGLAIASMVVGIVALLGGLLPFWGFALGVIAVVLGIIGLKKPVLKGMSIAGLVTGGIAVLWSIFVTFAFIMFLIAGAAVGTSAANEVNRLDAETQSLVDSKKNFSAGETAQFGENLEVTVNSVKRDFTPPSSYYSPSEGKEYIVLNVTVKNVGDETEFISSSPFSVNEDGVAVSPAFLTVDPDLGYGDVSPGASKTGNMVFEVSKGAKGLTLQYTETVYSFSDGAKKLTYTLAF